ncbi:glycosyl hydrolase [bacterium]|nr:glycosyl hydrolase [bacterium]
MKRLSALVLAFFVCAGAVATETKSKTETIKEDKSLMKTETFNGLAFRNIGPAIASGRVSDFAVHPKTRSTYYVAVASGGVWKTTNNGTTWKPIFDNEGSYSIGCITLDPKDPLTVWVGTGENNSQRSVGYGDGVYKSTDGGGSWKNMGLKDSEHIGEIVVDPRDSNTVYVAAQGPLWKDGGDRGLYKTKDGGITWKKVLEISDKTGVNEVWLDPRNPDVMYASAYQRRRHVWTLINGGPESAIYKSVDAGSTWKKLESGLPKADKGRIGLAVSSVNPEVIYGIVEAANKEGGFFRSTDGGSNWEKRSDYMTTSPQYYNEIIPDPKEVNKVYSMDTFMQVTEDGGKTFRKVGETWKHVDNHALWINPNDTENLLAGCDGGIYESFDGGKSWMFTTNLPVTQFYRVAVDNDKPFYNVYGGTQDNNTLGGPSRTISDHGITNWDWFVTVGGDGFEPAIDPEDPNIIYSESQHAGIVRFDRRSGETVDIQPQPEKGGDPLKWNWDTPLIISPHSHTRLYMAAQRIFRSEDRGDSWKAVSPDLTRKLDRNQLKVMGRVWSVDSVAKNASTSFYGNIVSLTESPLKEGLLYAGTDDGLVQVTEDGGANWQRIDKIAGVPEMTYVSDLEASQHNAGTVYAAFNNHKMGDFKPYVLKSNDRGKSWTSIAANLPARGSVWTLAEDHVNKDLLFAGTEFGIFFTNDGGRKWIQLKGNLPTIAIRDIAIQKRENDLVLATFGRGFAILDDYAPLRQVNETSLSENATLFPVRKVPLFVASFPLGFPGKGFQGDAFYAAPNPPFGAVISYYLKDELKSKRKARLDEESKRAEKNEDTLYPTWDELREEDREEEPAILMIVTDEEGNVVQRITGPTKAGFQRVAWNLRYPAFDPTQLEPPKDRAPWEHDPEGPLAPPGNYRVQLAKRVNGKLEMIGQPQSFHTETLGIYTLPEPDRKELIAFQQKTGRLLRAVLGASQSLSEAQKRISHLKKALDDTPAADPKLREDAQAIEQKLADISVILNGDSVKRKRSEATLPSLIERVQQIVSGHWSTTSAPTKTHHEQYDVVASEFSGVLAQLRKTVETDLKELETRAEKAGAPWTPGRVPTWNPE